MSKRRPKTPGIDAWKEAMDEFRAKEKEEIEYGFSLPPEYQPEGGPVIIPEGGPAIILGVPTYHVGTPWASADSDPGIDIKAFMEYYRKASAVIFPSDPVYDYREENITLDDGTVVHNCDCPVVNEYALLYWTCPTCKMRWMRAHDHNYWTASNYKAGTGTHRTHYPGIDDSETEKPKSIFDEIGDFSDTA